jgi:hypothetical protein
MIDEILSFSPSLLPSEIHAFMTFVSLAISYCCLNYFYTANTNELLVELKLLLRDSNILLIIVSIGCVDDIDSTQSGKTLLDDGNKHKR